MTSTRRTLLALNILAAIAVSGAATATASAECSGTSPEHKCIWEIKATSGGPFEKLEIGEEALVLTASPETTTFTLTAGTTHEIVCKKLESSGQLIGGSPGTSNFVGIALGECSVANANCKVKSKGDASAGEIFISNIKTKLVERTKGATKNILSDDFEQKTVEGGKEVVTLEFGTIEKVEEAGTKFEHRILTGTCEACAKQQNYPASTKVKGNIAGESKGEEINLPSPELSGNTLEAFGETAKLVGKLTLHLFGPEEYRSA